MSSQILKAGTVITMDPRLPRAEAVAVTDGRIAAVGSLADCQAASPDAEVVDTGVAALLPGFVEPHSHPVMSGVATQPPARSIAPWDAPTWSDVEKIFADAIKTTDPSTPLLFAGFDALLHQRPSPRADELDRIFGDRVAVITDNSGHGAYFNTALMKRNGWDVNPPADPVGARYGRNSDGSLNGQGFETAAIMAIAAPVLAAAGWQPAGQRSGVLRVDVARRLHVDLGHDVRPHDQTGLRGAGRGAVLPVAREHVGDVDVRRLHRAGKLRRG